MDSNFCKAKYDFEGVLIKDTEYEILDDSEQSVFIKNNEGNEVWYGRGHFVNSGYGCVGLDYEYDL
jgi:hypothetical protein